MSQSMSRRTFLKSTAALMAALSFSSLPSVTRRVRGESKLLSQGATQVDVIPSALTTNQPIADVAAGWDGTFWATDALGIAHVYDALQSAWQAFGRGVDAAAKLGDDLYLFRGGDVAVYNLTTSQAVSIQPISVQWPGLPPTFTSDLDGASVINGNLYLFRGGRYVNVNAPTQVQPMTGITAWPTDSWPSGVVERAGTVKLESSLPEFAVVFRWQNSTGAPDSRLVASDAGALLVFPGMTNLSSTPLYPKLEPILTGLFDAYIGYQDAGGVNHALIFQGPIVWTASDTQDLTATHLGTYQSSWAPVLLHAPRGQVGNLWTTTAQGVVMHDGTDWNVIAAPSGAAVNEVDVGADGQVFAVAQPAGGGAASLYAYAAATQAWQAPIALGSVTPQQLAVGDATRIFVLGTDGVAYRVQNGSVTPVTELGTNVKHIAANHDGTVWHSDGSANAFRFISERTYAPTSIPAGNVTAVQKVVSTAYGNALMLATVNNTPQLVTYTSPYVFKTSLSYVPIGNGRVIQHPQVTPGGGYCFVNLGSGIVALDSHTGAEIWNTALPNSGECASIVYDPANQQLYATDNAQTLFALDVATGSESWRFVTDVAPISEPVLYGGGLCVLGGGVVYWLNTTAALAQGNAQPVVPVWSTTLDSFNEFSVGIVLVKHNLIYVVLTETNTGNPAQQFWTLSMDGSAPTPLLQPWPSALLQGTYTPLLASGQWESQPAEILMINRDSLISAITYTQPVGGTTLYLNNGSVNFAPGLARLDDTVYAGGSDGGLYSLNLQTSLEYANFVAADPPTPTAGGVIAAGPMTVMTEGGGVIVFSLSLQGTNSVCLYDPANGNFLQLDTDHLLATQLVADTHGILYAAGSDPNDPSSPFGQVYAIRIDDLVQQERDFIVESELMQDFDAGATADTVAATARYQTHVTIVDALKAPRPFQAVKVWADQPVTVVIDGQSFAIDATTSAAVQTDATGTLTIVSDATDLTTTSLRLWAGFMNPFERILIYPDRSFHTRLTTTEYNAGVSSPDPTKINLATAAPYDASDLANTNPTPLLNSQQGPPVANAVQKMVSVAGFQTGSAVGGAPRGVHSAGRATADSYVAYADLAGVAYSPVSVPAARGAVPLAHGGLSFDGTTYTAMSAADAANAIDAMEGDPEELPGSFLSALKRLWDDIKKGAKAVAHVVVAVGRDIYVGIKYVADGVTKVLRQALRDIEDVAIAVGSFFVAVLKDVANAVEEVVEALSIIFHLGRVVVTARAIKATFTQMLNGLPTIIQGAQAKIDGIFNQVETDVANAFNGIVAALDGATAGGLARAGAGGIGNLQGMGATPHTIFSVAPKGTPPQTSQAVPAMWGVHKLRQNYPQATPSTFGRADAPAAADGLADTLQAFVESLLSGGSNHAKLTQLQGAFNSSIRFGSAKQFFDSLLADLLQAVEGLTEILLGAIQGLVDDVMNAAAEIAALIESAGDANIPILSALWHAVTGENLSWLDLIAFVIAIPTTLIYRIVEGEYPDVQATAGGVYADSVVLQRIQGIAGAITSLVGGFFNAILDAAYIIFGEFDLPLLAKILTVVLGLSTAFGLVAGDVLETDFWVIAASVILLVQTLLYTIYSLPPEIPSSMGLCFSPVLLWIFYEGYKAEPEPLTLSANVVGQLPYIINPIKFVPLTTLAPFIAPIADLACGLAVTGITLASTIEGWDDLGTPTALPESVEPARPQEHRVFLPSVHR